MGKFEGMSYKAMFYCSCRSLTAAQKVTRVDWFIDALKMRYIIGCHYVSERYIYVFIAVENFQDQKRWIRRCSHYSQPIM